MHASKPTVHMDVATIRTGHFRESEDYAAYRPDGTNDWLLIYTMRGSGRFVHAAGELHREAGQIVVIQPGRLHDYGTSAAARRWELPWAYFQPRQDWLEWLNWPQVTPGMLLLQIPSSQRQRIRDRLLDMHRLETGPLRLKESAAMTALEDVLLQCDQVNPLSEQSRLDSRL